MTTQTATKRTFTSLTDFVLTGIRYSETGLADAHVAACREVGL